ncbi:LysR family transcriptional regulator [Ornithinicoccus hortensis]|uniref:DNA-binding transcriptional LysR family regulator n=1 Tax=Ornithinicoccus hortensis TaxID=82346 RepID=A0A542YTF5_9MICO|nr:LysR family transcriptional regulator [Ornithinicoccus hortensis]TQL51368.1 DNA-binding transcriptional LysR family regulator [Ornithinicoccus hortensis]
MIDPRLQVLRLVAAHGTVTAAAAALNYTPSAVSHQLRSLARDLDLVLLEPDGRGVRLTASARLLVERGEELLARWEEIRAELAESEPERVGSLRLCGFSTAAAALLPQVAARVRAAHPYCTVRIIEADPADCFDLLLAGRADVAVVVAIPALPPPSDPRFDQEALLEDPLDLLVPANHPLARRSSVSLSEAAQESWILDRPGRPLHGLAQAACAAAGFSPSVAHEAAEWDTGAALVDAGLGVSLVPRLARLPGGYDITRVPLRGDPTPARYIRTGVRRGSSRQPVIAAALEALREVAAGAARAPASGPAPVDTAKR